MPSAAASMASEPSVKCGPRSGVHALDALLLQPLLPGRPHGRVGHRVVVDQRVVAQVVGVRRGCGPSSRRGLHTGTYDAWKMRSMREPT